MMVQRRQRPQPIMPLASMGDIAFLLIIFFMITSNFLKESHVELKQAGAPNLDRMEETTISVSVDVDGKVYLQGGEITVEALQGAIGELVGEKDNVVVMLKIDRDLSHDRYGPVMSALSEAGVGLKLVGLQEEP